MAISGFYCSHCGELLQALPNTVVLACVCPGSVAAERLVRAKREAWNRERKAQSVKPLSPKKGRR